MIIDKGIIKKIHVNKHHIKQNKKLENKKPIFTIKTYKSNDYGKEVQILDKNENLICKLIYSPDKPLKCGAVAWIETREKVKIL